MTGVTPELLLATATDSDQPQDYLTRSLVVSLQRIDGLFNQSVGHTHSGPGQGGPVSGTGGGGTLVWRGTWTSTGTYAVNNAVAYNNSSYLAYVAVGPTATPPSADPSHWGVLAQGGVDTELRTYVQHIMSVLDPGGPPPPPP